jgi:beta-glucosidase-like glycosyl hydrolase/CubicO group peptidase (beta-lactamase class C family)
MKQFVLALFTAFIFTNNTFSQNSNPCEYTCIDTSYFWVDSVFNSLTLDQRIAQLIMVDAYSNQGIKEKQKIEKLVRDYNIGGIIFFQGGPVRQANLTNHYQKLAQTPIMIAMDAEWGLAMRLDSIDAFPRQMMLGAISNNGLIYDMGLAIGNQCRRLGVHVNFAPVVDINNNPDNPVINSRSFGENKIKVLRKAFSYMQGMIDQRLIVSAKHFPGHGDTDADSHHALPVINHSVKRLDKLELFPYKHLIKLGLNGIMVAHLQVNALDNREHRPSSISKPTITGLLKEKMKYTGLIFTDALNMRGVADYYEPGQLEVEALKAGNDVLLYPADAEISIKTIKKAIKNGDIPESTLNTRCKRVLAAKYWLGLDTLKPVQTRNLVNDLNPPKTDELNHWIASEAITCIKNNDNILPFSNKALDKIAVVTIGAEENSFHKRIKDYTDPEFYYLSNNITPAKIKSTLKKIQDYENIILAVQGTSNSPYRNYGLTESVKNTVEAFSQLSNVTLIYFGNPYALEKLEKINNFRSIVITYHDNKYTYDYAAQALFGGIYTKGTLPVSISGFKAGTNIHLKKTRLGYVHPDMVGADPYTLLEADQIATNSIDINATPGCVILAARNGNVFYYKAFGYHTYDKKQKVELNDIYDLASVTKISASAPALMRLYGEQKFHLQKTIGDYLPLPDSSNPGSRKIINVLTHQARLKAWHPFYREMLDSAGKYKPRFFSSKKRIDFQTKVANHLYASKNAEDTLYHILDTLPLRDKEGYLYSDIGYYYMYKIVEAITGKPFDVYLKTTFYDPMKCMSTGFNPYLYKDLKKIVPTENDTIFRKQLLHGYVHDPGAALLGGICGHAGLFSNANDLAKIGQMFLNMGKYGDDQFISPNAIKFFTTASFTNKDNRRGIAFDKPEYRRNYIGPTFWGIPLDSYGHSGFTGTYLWLDPESGILFVFLSNRIHPDSENRKLITRDIRTRLHKVFYEAIKPKQMQ